MKRYVFLVFLCIIAVGCSNRNTPTPDIPINSSPHDSIAGGEGNHLESEPLTCEEGAKVGCLVFDKTDTNIGTIAKVITPDHLVIMDPNGRQYEIMLDDHKQINAEFVTFNDQFVVTSVDSQKHRYVSFNTGDNNLDPAQKMLFVYSYLNEGALVEEQVCVDNLSAKKPTYEGFENRKDVSEGFSVSHESVVFHKTYEVAGATFPKADFNFEALKETPETCDTSLPSVPNPSFSGKTFINIIKPLRYESPHK